MYPGSVSVLTERLSVGVAEEGVLVSAGGTHTTRMSVTDGGEVRVHLENPAWGQVTPLGWERVKGHLW